MRIIYYKKLIVSSKERGLNNFPLWRSDLGRICLIEGLKFLRNSELFRKFCDLPSGQRRLEVVMQEWVSYLDLVPKESYTLIRMNTSSKTNF